MRTDNAAPYKPDGSGAVLTVAIYLTNKKSEKKTNHMQTEIEITVETAFT